MRRNSQRVREADVLMSGDDERPAALRELRRDVAHVSLDHGIGEPCGETGEVKDSGSLALDEAKRFGGILHRLRRLLVEERIVGVHPPAQPAASRPGVVVQLQLGCDLLEQLFDALFLERVDDYETIARADEELDLLEKIGFSHRSGMNDCGRRTGCRCQTLLAPPASPLS